MEQSVKFVLRARWTKKLQALHRAPKLANEAVLTGAQRAAAWTVIAYQEGLRQNSLRLRPLKPSTVKAKRRLGMKRPRSPLYGLGEDNRDSLANGLVVRNWKRGGRTTVTITPSRRAHHARVRRGRKLRRAWGDRRVPISLLIHVHEFGAFIRRGKGTIIIPPRPAVRTAFERALRKVRGTSRNKQMRAALAELINRSVDTRFRSMARFEQKEREILDRRG